MSDDDCRVRVADRTTGRSPEGGSEPLDLLARWGLRLMASEEQPPEPKWTMQDVPGADGSVDLSLALAKEPTYKDREVRLTLLGGGESRDASERLASEVVHMLHGRRWLVQTPRTARLADSTGAATPGWYDAALKVAKVTPAALGVVIEMELTCSPFVYTSTGSATLATTPVSSEPAHVLEPSEATGLTLDGLSEGRVRLVAENGDWRYRYHEPCDRMALTLAYSDNLFDASHWRCLAIAQRQDEEPVRWVQSVVMRRRGQSLVFGDVAKNWVERFSLVCNTVPLTKTSPAPTFPFTGDRDGATFTLRLGGTVTALGDSPRITLGLVQRATGEPSLGNGGMADATDTSEKAYIPKSAGESLDGKSVTITTDQPVAAVTVTVSGITGTDVVASLSLAHGKVESAPDAPADNEEMQVSLPAAFMALGNGSANLGTDRVAMDASGLSMAKAVDEGRPDARWGTLAPSPRAVAGASPMWPSRDRPRHVCCQPVSRDVIECQSTRLAAVQYPASKTTIDIGDAPSEPELSCGDAVLLSVDGGPTLLLRPGTSRIGTLSRGPHELEYSVLGDSEATVTWSRGVF